MALNVEYGLRLFPGYLRFVFYTLTSVKPKIKFRTGKCGKRAGHRMSPFLLIRRSENACLMKFKDTLVE